MVVAWLSMMWHALDFEAHVQGQWMGTNLILAVLPGTGAVLLHHWRGRRRWPWWAGVAVVTALLPNAPYVLSDIIHLGPDLHAAPSRADAVFGVMPLFVLLIGTGVLSYSLVLHILRRELGHRGWSRRRLVVAEAAVDTVCAVGVGLGRIPRLNSWDVIRPFHMLHGLEVVAFRPEYLIVALVGIAAASITADRVATGTVHALRARRRR
jgi:uncharacterized membrane protein